MCSFIQFKEKTIFHEYDLHLFVKYNDYLHNLNFLQQKQHYSCIRMASQEDQEEHYIAEVSNEVSQVVFDASQTTAGHSQNRSNQIQSHLSISQSAQTNNNTTQSGVLVNDSLKLNEQNLSTSSSSPSSENRLIGQQDESIIKIIDQIDGNDKNPAQIRDILSLLDQKQIQPKKKSQKKKHRSHNPKDKKTKQRQLQKIQQRPQDQLGQYMDTGVQNHFQNKREEQNQQAVLTIGILIEKQLNSNFQTSVQFADSSMKLGQIYKNNGNYPKSLDHFDKSQQIYQSKLIQDPNNQNYKTKYVSSFCWIIRNQISKGNYKSTLKLCQDKKQYAEVSIGIQNLLYTDIIHFIGIINAYLGDKRTAIEYFTRSLQIQQNIQLNPDKINETASEIAINECQLKNLHSAIIKMNKIKSSIGEINKKNYLMVSEMILHFGTICKQTGIYDEALSNYRQCLKIRKQFCGHNHPKVARVLTYIGQIHMLKGQYQNSLQNLLKSFEIMEQKIGKDNDKSYHNLMLIGQVFIRKQQYELAFEYLLKSSIKINHIFDENNPHHMQILHSMAQIYNKTQNYSMNYIMLCKCRLIKQKFKEKETQQYKDLIHQIMQLENNNIDSPLEF